MGTTGGGLHLAENGDGHRLQGPVGTRVGTGSGLWPLTMSSIEPSLRLLPPWERSVSTVSCMLPSWWGAEGGESEGPHSQATPPGRPHRGWGDHQGQLGDAQLEG